MEAVYVHGDEAAAEVAEDLSEGIREMVAINLQPSTVYRLVYGGHAFPTIKNVNTLRDESQFWTLGEKKVTALLKDTSSRTACLSDDPIGRSDARADAQHRAHDPGNGDVHAGE